MSFSSLSLFPFLLFYASVLSVGSLLPSPSPHSPVSPQMTKENKVLKRMSQRLMPLLPTLPEDSAAVTFDLNADLSAQCADAVDGGEDDGGEEALRNQSKIAGKKPASPHLL